MVNIPAIRSLPVPSPVLRASFPLRLAVPARLRQVTRAYLRHGLHRLANAGVPGKADKGCASP